MNLNEELKTGFEWCIQFMMSPVSIINWETEWAFYMDSFYNERINLFDFNKRISSCPIVKNEIPTKPPMFLQYRMYGFVPYNLSPIQQGIQFGHGVVEYGLLSREIPPFQSIYDKWANEDKTFIILNGGTTNDNQERLGTMQQHLLKLKENDVSVAEFREPDLNDALTAVVFLVDERVYNKVLYPDFEVGMFPINYEDIQLDSEDNRYKDWLKRIGGKSNLFLREFLPNFKLA